MQDVSFFFFLSIISILALLASPMLAAHFVLRPVVLAGRGRGDPTQYGVIDLVCLTFYLAVAVALVKLARFELVSQRQEMMLILVVGLFVAATWWLGVRALSRAGVTDPLRRGVYLGIAVPAAYGGLAALPPASWMLIYAYAEGPGAEGLIGSGPVVIAIYLLLVVGLFLARQIAHWVSTPVPNAPD